MGWVNTFTYIHTRTHTVKGYLTKRVIVLYISLTQYYSTEFGPHWVLYF